MIPTIIPMEYHSFECECHSPEHIIRFTLDTDESDHPDLYADFLMNAWKPWYKRIWMALKYVLGMKTSRYGHFDIWTLNPTDAEKLIVMLNRYVTARNNFDKKNPSFKRGG